MLSKNFIDEYTKLEQERDGGKDIWRLCEMSAEVVVPRGGHYIQVKYNRKQETGDTQRLAMQARKDVDTIGRRAFAWREWERFQMWDLHDENGEELDYSHRQIRDRLFYSHFAELGRLVEDGKITPDTSKQALIDAVKNNLSVSKMMADINILFEEEEYFYKETWPKFQKKARRMLHYPQVVGRRRRLLKELSGTDWDAKEAK